MLDFLAKLRQLLRAELDPVEEGGHHCHWQCSLERSRGENKSKILVKNKLASLKKKKKKRNSMFSGKGSWWDWILMWLNDGAWCVSDHKWGPDRWHTKKQANMLTMIIVYDDHHTRDNKLCFRSQMKIRALTQKLWENWTSGCLDA